MCSPIERLAQVEEEDTQTYLSFFILKHCQEVVTYGGCKTQGPGRRIIGPINLIPIIHPKFEQAVQAALMPAVHPIVGFTLLHVAFHQHHLIPQLVIIVDVRHPGRRGDQPIFVGIIGNLEDKSIKVLRPTSTDHTLALFG